MRTLDVDAAARVFEENFSEHGELGASVSVWQAGKEILGLARGYADRDRTIAWSCRTPVLIWSATKGLAAACVLHCLQQSDFPPTTAVAAFWPEFAQGGKGGVTVAQLLSHQAGLAALSADVSVWDYPAVIAALEAQEPAWAVGESHGYHPRTFGFCCDEIVRRLTRGTSLGAYWQKTFAEPMGLRLWIGAPPDLIVSPVFPARGAAAGTAFRNALARPGSLTARAFASPAGLHSVASMNTLEARAASFPAWGGIGTASSLAEFYAMLARGGIWEDQRLFSAPTLASMATALTSGMDRVLQLETAFAAGFMKDPLNGEGKKIREMFGPSLLAFGHPGAGGSLAFADPENQVSFAYVMNQMEHGVLPNVKALSMVDALFA